LDRDRIARGEPDKFQPQFAGHVSEQPMAIGQFHSVPAVRQYFHYLALGFNRCFAGHVKISGSESVISTVCSK
jgi:hypothetical protein